MPQRRCPGPTSGRVEAVLVLGGQQAPEAGQRGAPERLLQVVAAAVNGAVLGVPAAQWPLTGLLQTGVPQGHPHQAGYRLQPRQPLTGRAGQGRSGQGRSAENRSDQNRLGQVKSCQVKED